MLGDRYSIFLKEPFQEQTWRSHAPQLQIMLQSPNYKNSMLLAEK